MKLRAHPLRRMASKLLVAAGLAASACACVPPAQTRQAPLSGERIAASGHIVYLHGKIVQEEGINAVSSEFGPYQFNEIVAALGKSGAVVHAPVRAKGANFRRSGSDVAALVRELISSGVRASEITVVGASHGAVIAMVASAELSNPELRFVLMGACDSWVNDELKPDLHGRILSIYEQGDAFGGSCDRVISGKSGVVSYREIRLATGLGHGFLFRPLPEWVEPALDWSAAESAASSR